LLYNHTKPYKALQAYSSLQNLIKPYRKNQLASIEISTANIIQTVEMKGRIQRLCLRTTGITAPYALDGAMNSATFRGYVEQILVPTLRLGDISLWTICPATRRQHREAIENRQAKFLYLSPAIQPRPRCYRTGLCP